jgi:flagellar hook-basal body complex protein FliE
LILARFLVVLGQPQVSAGKEKDMNVIDPGRLMQMRTSIISQNDALRRVAGDAQTASTAPIENGFGHILTSTVRSVNAQQTKAEALAASYERGETNDIVNVMIERQKASIGFEATVQVRNKLLSAYRDIMSMPV